MCFCLHIYGRLLLLFVPTRLSMVVFLKKTPIQSTEHFCVVYYNYAERHLITVSVRVCILWCDQFPEQGQHVKKNKKKNIDRDNLLRASTTINDFRTVLYTQLHSKGQTVGMIFSHFRKMPPVRIPTSSQ